MLAKSVRMSDIAEKLQVSTVTVSKALAGKDGVSEELRIKIQQLAEEMGYRKKVGKSDGNLTRNYTRDKLHRMRPCRGYPVLRRAGSAHRYQR